MLVENYISDSCTNVNQSILNSQLLHTVDNLGEFTSSMIVRTKKVAFGINIPGDTLSGYPEGKKTELSTSNT